MSPSPAAERAAPRRCLVISGGTLARTLADLTAVASLARDRHVTWLGPEAQRAVLDPSLLRWRLRDDDQDAGKTLSQPISLSLEDAKANTLRTFRFDESVVLHAPKHRHLPARAGIPERWGYGGFWSGRFFTSPVPPSQEQRVERDALPLLRAMSVEPRPEPLFLSDTWRRAGRERLQQAKLNPEDEVLIGLYAGCEQGFQRDMWPTENFESLLRELRKARPNARYVILSGEVDLWTSVLLFERTGKIHPVVGPDLTLDGLAAVLSKLDLVVAADSGMLHLAAAVGTPTLGLFRRNAQRYAPRGREPRFLQRSKLKTLGVQEVVDAVELRLAAESGPPEIDGGRRGSANLDR